MSVSRAETEVPKCPETKLIGNLTKEDMRRIADMTGGIFFENGYGNAFTDPEAAVTIKGGQLGIVTFELCTTRPEKEKKTLSLIMRVVGNPDVLFGESSMATFSKDSIIIEDPKGANPQKSLTIKPGQPNKITFTQKMELGPIVQPENKD